MEFDVSIGSRKDAFVDPVVVLDAKVELDSSRLKTAVALFAMLKRWKPKAKCRVVYVRRELENSLLKIAGNWADGIFQMFSLNLFVYAVDDEKRAYMKAARNMDVPIANLSFS